MKWKEYYRKEFTSPKTKDYLIDLFERQEKTHPLNDLLRTGAIFSFPHTSIFYAGDAQTQVVSSLYRSEVEQVIALGVFHIWGHEETKDLYCQAMDEHEEEGRRMQAFSHLKGAFLPKEGFYHTPYGRLPFASFRPPESEILRRDREGILKQEFSLDTFLTLVKLYSLIHDVPVLPVLPIYIGMTRDPTRDLFEVASRVAAAINSITSPTTAIVATGDVVHYGTGYSPPAVMHGMPTTAKELEELLRKEIKDVLNLVVTQKDYAQAFPKLDRFLNNDQRYLLPVLAEIVGKDTGYDILSFHLSDYSAINEVEPPCFVASSLIAYEPASVESKESGNEQAGNTTVST